MPIEYMVCFICSELCIKSISPRKNVDLFSSVFKKSIPKKHYPYFLTSECVNSTPYLLSNA